MGRQRHLGNGADIVFLDSCSSQVPISCCHQCCSFLIGAGIREFVQRSPHYGSGTKSNPLLLSSNDQLSAGWWWWEVGVLQSELRVISFQPQPCWQERRESAWRELEPRHPPLQHPKNDAPPQWLATHSDEHSYLLSRALSPSPSPTQHQASPPSFQLYRLFYIYLKHKNV